MRKQLRNGWVRGHNEDHLQAVTFFTGDDPQKKVIMCHAMAVFKVVDHGAARYVFP